MNIKPYTGYFHDGTIVVIKQFSNAIEIWMESSEIIPDYNIDVPLSKTKRIAGKLILKGVKKILQDDVLVNEIKQDFDYAGILELYIHNDVLGLSIELYKNNQINKIMNFEQLTIHANKIEWENIPDLLDSF